MIYHLGTPPWSYRGARSQKVLDPDGVTAELVRCPDPTALVVIMLIRTALEG